jgi:uncharacterized protein (DUF1800 family)
MGDENTVLGRAEARHLLRRTGFGALPRDVDQIVDDGETRGAAADRLIGFKPKTVRPNGRDFPTAHNKWIKTLLKTRAPLQSKLVLFWHDHFATGISKVGDAGLMADQIQLLYQLCKGDMRALVKAISKNPAMMEFLDTVRNDKDVPNENYARELQELFTLGVEDFAGSPNYTQDDIVQIARAFTGWRYDGRDAFLDEGDHDFAADFPERGAKVIYRSTGGFGSAGRSFTVNGEGDAEIDAVVDVIFAHRDSAGKNTVARRTAHRLLEYFAHPNPSQTVADEVVAASGFDTTFDVAALLRAILVHDAFYESMAPAPFGAGTKKSVKWPIDYVVSTLRLLGMRFKGRDLNVDGGSFRSALDQLSNMGQVLLDPPSVFGWDWETAWISSATLLARYGFARDLMSARGRGPNAFRPERLMDLDLTDPGAIVDAVTTFLGVDDQLTGAERTVLVDYLTDDGANPTLDLNDYDVRNTKLHGLFALVLQSPAYQVH